MLNRRGFMRIVAGALAIPAIGLPAVAPGAPAISWTIQTYSGKAHYVYLAATYQFEADNVKESGFITYNGVRFYYNERLPA